MKKALSHLLQVQISAPEGAAIQVDGKFVGLAPLPHTIALRPGKYAVGASHSGANTVEEVTGVAGQSVELRLFPTSPTNKAPAPSPPGPAPAPVTAAPYPQPAPTSPSPPPNTPERQGFFEWAAESPVAWVGGALTLVGAAGGITFATLASSSYDSANTQSDAIKAMAAQDALDARGICSSPPTTLYSRACSSYDDHVATAESRETLAWVGFGVAGVAAVGTVIYYFVSTPEGTSQSGQSLTLQPQIGADSTPGLMVSGRF